MVLWSPSIWTAMWFDAAVQEDKVGAQYSSEFRRHKEFARKHTSREREREIQISLSRFYLRTQQHVSVYKKKKVRESTTQKKKKSRKTIPNANKNRIIFSILIWKDIDSIVAKINQQQIARLLGPLFKD